ncbi:MAG: hypothetical protein V3V18_08160 [Methylococcales bacterium]
MQLRITHNQSGSAMTEFVVLAVVLVPALTMMPWMGKVSSINQTTIQASRYAAWEMTVTDKSPSQLRDEVENRFFTDADVMLNQNQGKGVITSKNALWSGISKNQNGSQNRLFTAGQNNLLLDINDGEIPNKAGGVLVKGVHAMGALSSVISDAKWDLRTNGLYDVEVRANIGSNHFFAGKKDCFDKNNNAVFACVSRNNSILVDTWSAESAEQVEERTMSLVPLGILRPVGNALALLGKLPMITDIAGLEDAFGQVQPDVLPPDRHGPVK